MKWQGRSELTRINDRLDTIVRKPFGQDQKLIPVGVVSKEYAFVPHADLLDIAAKALGKGAKGGSNQTKNLL